MGTIDRNGNILVMPEIRKEDLEAMGAAVVRAILKKHPEYIQEAIDSAAGA